MQEVRFYTYLWLRQDGSPFYVGKGKGKRAYVKENHRFLPPPRHRIKLQYWPDEKTALAYERYLIDFWGRKDKGSGCLRNFTDGGDGSSNPSEESLIKRRAARKKQTPPMLGRTLTLEQRKKISEANRRRVWTKSSRQKLAEFRRTYHAKKCGVRSDV
jgi:hypothetical protein